MFNYIIRIVRENRALNTGLRFKKILKSRLEKFEARLDRKMGWGC